MAASQKEIEKLHKLYAARGILQAHITDLIQLTYRYVSVEKSLEDLSLDQEIIDVIDVIDEMIKDLQLKQSIAEEHLASVRSQIAEIEDRLH